MRIEWNARAQILTIHVRYISTYKPLSPRPIWVLLHLREHGDLLPWINKHVLPVSDMNLYWAACCIRVRYTQKIKCVWKFIPSSCSPLVILLRLLPSDIILLLRQQITRVEVCVGPDRVLGLFTSACYNPQFCARVAGYFCACRCCRCARGRCPRIMRDTAL